MNEENIESTRKILRYMSRLERQRRRFLNERLHEKNLRASMYMAILFLDREPGSSQDELGVFLGIDKSGVARKCRRMEDLGYIRREQSQDDRRQNEMYLTQSGRALLPIIRNLMQEWRETVTVGMNEHDQKELLRLLEQMMNNASREDE